MAVISVEVPDMIATKFSAKKIVYSYELYEELQNKDILVNCWKKGIWKKEFSQYLEYKKTI